MTAAQFGKPFLSAEWRYLALLNYQIDGEILRPLVPRGTEVDSFDGKTFVSMVGFLFENTRVMGLPIPFHEHFEEINLRFYVRRRADDGWRRGVVFIKEIVPRPAIAWVARWLYNENSVALPTGHGWVRAAGDAENIESVQYSWTLRTRAELLEVITAGAPIDFVPGSEEEFIAEHYWGYSRQRAGGTVEYRVDHPPWRIWQARSARLQCDGAALYGAEFAALLGGAPASAFVAEGSAVTVYRGVRIV